MNTRNGLLTAGGAPVHRSAPSRPGPAPRDDDAPPRVDPTPIPEQYVTLARHMHRTATTERAERWLWGCSCGEYGLGPSGARVKTEMVAMQHVVDAADRMMKDTEPEPVEPEDT